MKHLLENSHRKIHGLSFFNALPGVKFVICMALSICAFVARKPEALGMLLFADIVAFMAFCGLKIKAGKALKFLLWQTIIITGLYVIRYGYKAGIVSGLMISLQLFLAFFPGIIFVRSTSDQQIIQMLSRVMTYRAAFVLSASIRFIPLIMEEIRIIYEAQVMRGANILPRDLLKPWHWPDFINCIVIPAVVRMMGLAGETAFAAQARGFGVRDKRTCWPGE